MLEFDCISFLMGPKLKEMDEVIEMVHRSSLWDKKNHQTGTLLVSFTLNFPILLCSFWGKYAVYYFLKLPNSS